MRTAEEKLEAIRNEIAHAKANQHVLDRDCQGVAPGQLVTAVRADYLLAVLDSN